MANARTLIVCYSRTGTTRRVAEALAAALHCDLEPIVEPTSRRGVVGYFRSVLEARQQRPAAAVSQAVNDPAQYDLVVLGTPVWAWSVSSPMRAYMMANRARFPAVAFFCTCGGSGSDSTFAQMQQLAGKAARARLWLTARRVAKQQMEPQLTEFLLSLTAPAADSARYANAAKTSAIAVS